MNAPNPSATPMVGRTAVVVGAGRGIGRAIAETLAAAGADLVLASRTGSELDECVLACRANGGQAKAVPSDVADPSQAHSLIASAVGSLGRIDVLVISSGAYGPIGPIEENDPDEWKRAVEINLFGPLYLAQAVVPHMRAQGAGKIIILAGGGATSPLPLFSAYAASKAALVRLAETLAQELRDSNVQVNAIAPGLVDTQIQDEVLAAGSRAGAQYDRIREIRQTGEGAVSPDLAANLALFLASEASGALTGKLIAAPHDPWETWNGKEEELNSTQMYTLRRLDPYTLESLRNDGP